jgi:hypothetical protein
VEAGFPIRSCSNAKAERDPSRSGAALGFR